MSAYESLLRCCCSMKWTALAVLKKLCYYLPPKPVKFSWETEIDTELLFIQVYIDNNGHGNGRISAQESRNFPLLTFEQYLVVQKDEPSRENWDWNCIRVFIALCIYCLSKVTMLWNLTSSPLDSSCIYDSFVWFRFFWPNDSWQISQSCRHIFWVW